MAPKISSENEYSIDLERAIEKGHKRREVYLQKSKQNDDVKSKVEITKYFDGNNRSVLFSHPQNDLTQNIAENQDAIKPTFGK